MPDQSYEISPELAEHIESRMSELGLGPSALAAATGLSLTILGQVRKGYRKRYQDRLKWPICDALGWTRDSIDRILDGGKPVYATRPAGDAEMLAELLDEIRLLRADVQNLRVQLPALADRVGALETQLRSSSPQRPPAERASRPTPAATPR